MANQLSESDREYQLIEKLELRIASADTDAKFESILQKFLPALLLKLASESARNRNLTIKVCQYIKQRLTIDNSISLPIQPLLKTFREAQNAFVKRFALVFIEQGLNRQPSSETLPELLRLSVPQHDTFDSSDGKMWSVAFDYLLQMLPDWRIPDHATKEDMDLKDTFNLSAKQLNLLSITISKFLMFDPKVSPLQNTQQDEFQSIFERHFRARSRVVLPIAKFLFSAVFSDEDRLMPATILSVDANEPASSLGDAMFKQCNFDFESEKTVDLLFSLYDAGKTKLQIRVLTLLSRSQKSTERATKILEVVENQLFQNVSGLDAAKLRSTVFSYLNWAVRMSKTLEMSSQRLQSVLKEFIELQGWPVLREPAAVEIDLRAKAYEGIGLLAALRTSTSPFDAKQLLDLIIWLFTSLRCDTSRDIRGSIDEALNRILNIATISDGADQRTLKDLLLWNAAATEGDEDDVYFLPTRNSTTYAAVRFANKCLPFADVDARYIDLVALGRNDRREIAEEAARGLDPYWHMSNSRLRGRTTSNSPFPDFASFSTRAFSESQGKYQVKQNSASASGAVLFGRNLLVIEALRHTHQELGSDTDWRSRIDAVMNNEPSARQKVRSYLRTCSTSALLQLTEAALKGLSLGLTDCADVALELVALSPNDVLLQLKPEVLLYCQKALPNVSVQYRASRIVGILVSLSSQGTERAAEALGRCNVWSTSIGQEAVATRGSMLSAASIITRLQLRRSNIATETIADQMMTVAIAVATESRDQALKHAAYTSLGQMGLCQPSKVIAGKDLTTTHDVLFADAKKEDETAVTCLGRLLNASFSTSNKEATDQMLERLFALHEVRKAEFHFALGEAMAVAALGFRSTSTIAEFDVDAACPDWGYHPELLSVFLSRAITDSKTTKPSLRKAAGIWLLCLIQFCSETELLRPHLRESQAAFAGLLNNRDDIVQETGSRGLSLVYEKGDKNLQDDLVRDLVQSFTGGVAKMSGTVNEETQLFEAGTLPTEAGQSVTTYKDIVSLATEMGDPSLVYRFMNLASSNAIWSSRAAFGRFGLSGVLADSTYLTENKKFYPKLFRYRFDPNPNVQRSMDEIWKALVKDSKKVIDENFDLILEDLLKNVVSGKEWRAREASCAAISDLVQGAEVEKFEMHLDDIWQMAFKVLDDVKETVRLAAMKLCRTLTNMLIRNLEVGEGNTKRATIMLNRAIPFLLQQMEGGSAQEVQQYAVVTLLEVVKKSPPRSLQQFAPTILETLILSLSSLEHESINYLHLNADKYGLTAEKLDKMRVSSINASPITDAIERCLESLTSDLAHATDPLSQARSGKPSAVEDAMQRLERAFKTAIGLPSKVGLSRVLITLVVRHNTMFRPFADRFAQLTRKNILDRNATISVSFSMALAYLMRLASDKEVQATCQYAQRLYFESEELSHRAVAGEIVQAISKASNDVFMKFASTLLAFAFVGQNDIDEEVRAKFDPSWKDNIGGSRALNLYLSEIVSLVGMHIKSSLWPIRQACCLAVADLIETIESSDQYTEVEANLLWPVMEEALNGKTWEGKEKVVLVFPKFAGKSKSLWTSKAKAMKSMAMREAKRNNGSYRPYAITALGEFALSRPDLDLDTDVVKLLTNVAEGLSDNVDDGEAMQVDGEEGSKSRQIEDTWVAIAKCLFQVLSRHTDSQILDQALSLVRQARENRSIKIDAEIYDGARRYITHINGSGNGCEITNDRGQARQSSPVATSQLAGFWQQLTAATFGADTTRHSSDNEKIRKLRVDLASTMAESHILDPVTCETLAAILNGWSRTERSRPLKLEVDKATELLKIYADNLQYARR